MPDVLVEAIVSAARDAKRVLGEESFSEFRVALEQKDVPTVAELIAATLLSGNREVTQNLLKARECFESAACCRIAEVYGGEIPDVLDHLFNEMQMIAVKLWSPKNADQFNQLDLQFHRLIGRLGEIDEAQLIADAIESTESRYGMPASTSDMRSLHEEHKAILDAIKSREPEPIGIAVQSHIQVAYARWVKSQRVDDLHLMPHTLRQDVIMLDRNSTDEKLAAIGDAYVPDLLKVQRSEVRDSATWDLEFHAQFPEEYVLFRVCDADGAGRHFREIIAHSPDFGVISKYSRKIDPDELANVRMHYFE